MPETARALAGCRVLLVEDEYVIAMEMARWLSDAGAQVIGPAPDVEQALDLIEDDRMHAAVLDINLGRGATSYPVADRLEDLGVPFLFATGDVQRTSPVVHRARPRLIKPYTGWDLVQAVQMLLSQQG